MRATLSRATPAISLVAPSKLTPARCSAINLLEATFIPSYLPSRSASTSLALYPVRVAQAQRSFPDMSKENFAGSGCKQAEGRTAEQNKARKPKGSEGLRATHLHAGKAH